MQTDTLKFTREVGVIQFLTGDFWSATATTDVQDPFRREIHGDNTALEKSFVVLGQIKQLTGCLVLFKAPKAQTPRRSQTALQSHLVAGYSVPPWSPPKLELPLASEGFLDLFDPVTFLVEEASL
eukprot:scaffold23644_cov53-Attheya_sp.AAC.1